MVNAPRRCQLHITEVRRKRSGISATNARELTRIIERVVGSPRRICLRYDGEKERSQKSEVRREEGREGGWERLEE